MTWKKDELGSKAKVRSCRVKQEPVDQSTSVVLHVNLYEASTHAGVPVTEKSQAKRYGDDPRFQEYKATTSTLIPLPKFRRPDSKAE